MTTLEHSWLPRTSCDERCVEPGPDVSRAVAIRKTRRVVAAVLMIATLPLLALPMPGRSRAQRLYCRMVLRCLGIRITVSGGPIRNLNGMLVVSNHVSWVDVFVIGSVLPGSFVARADLVEWPGVGLAARLMKVIPIDRASLRGLPAVVTTMTQRLRDGHTVVAFPEGTTYCGVDRGTFKPAMFQAAVDAQRPVQPLQLSYHHRDGRPSTVTAFLGEDTLWASVRRTVHTPLTMVHMNVQPLQLPADDRRELAARCGLFG